MTHIDMLVDTGPNNDLETLRLVICMQTDDQVDMYGLTLRYTTILKGYVLPCWIGEVISTKSLKFRTFEGQNVLYEIHN